MKNIVKSNRLGLFLSVVLTIICIVVFYHKLVFNLNSIYFVDSGDGIQSYFGVMYHVQNGKDIFHFEGMNYPYGENFFFSVNPAIIGLFLKIVNQIIDLSAYTLGIINGFMFLSLILSSVFIYLILLRFKMNNWYRVLLPVFITFVCPQIYRMGGHYSLASLFVIPGIIWFVIKFDEKPSYILSFFIGLYTLFVATLHLYFFAFSLLIWVLYYFYKAFYTVDFNIKGIAIKFSHLFIQVFLPYIIISLLVSIDTHISDRTNTPYGLLVYTNNFYSLFYPFGRVYENFISWFINPGAIGGGGFEYLGAVAAISLVLVILKVSANIFSFNKNIILSPFKEPIIDFLCFVALISLLISYAFPFEQRYGQLLLDNVGLFKQFRGIARFSWITYFSVSIVAVYLIFVKNKSFILRIIVLIVFITDVYGTNHNVQNTYNNRIEELEDKQNNLELNTWIKGLRINDYQSILVFPYYNNGSENVYDERGGWSLRYGMIAALKTGLPLIPIHLSRTSISQAQNNFNLVQEPYRYPQILNKFQKDKKILIIVIRSDINENEKNFLDDCTFLTSNKYFDYYEITVQKLSDRFLNLYSKKRADIEKHHQSDNIYNSKLYYFNDFENYNQTIGYNSKGSWIHPAKHFLTFFEDTLPNAKRGEYLVSFWVGNFNRDLIPRSYYQISIRDKFGRYYENRLSILGKEFKIIDNDWALIESTIELNNPDDIVRLTIWNSDLSNDISIVDRLLIRPINTTVSYVDTGIIFYNNRIYLKDNN